MTGPLSTSEVQFEEITDQRNLCYGSVFGWEFFIPDGADFGVDEDRRLLAKAVRLATRQTLLNREGSSISGGAACLTAE